MALIIMTLDLPRSFFDRLDDELSRSVRAINTIMRKSFDTTKITKEELTRQLDAADRMAGTARGRTWWEGETLIVEWPDRTRTTVSAIDRIKAKALQARGIAPAAIKDFEADLDGLIAEGPRLAADRAAAVGKHAEAFKGIREQFDGLHSAIDILSNGGDPLEDSEHSAQGS